MSENHIRVGLVDDQQLVRAGFRMVIDSQADLEVVLEAGDGAQAVHALDPAALTATGPVDVVLMDVRMPTMDGLTATAQITARGTEAHPAPRVIVLLARGRSNTEIGSDLFVAEATVKTHVGRILAKLHARDRVQAVVVAYETGLVRPGS